MNDLRYHVNLNKLLNEFYNKNFIIDDLQKRYYLKLLAEQISNGYKIVDKYLLNSAKNNNIQISCQEFNKEKIEDSYLDPLYEINEVVKEELLNHIKGFFYHGSMSTMDYAKGWSDIDSFIIIKKESICDPQKLLEVKSAIEKIYNLKIKFDPLQHHGVNIFTEYDLLLFPDTFIPLNTVGPISAVKGSIMSFNYNLRETNFNKKNSLIGLLKFLQKTHKKGIFEHHPYKNEYLLSEFRNRQNGMYQMKYYLGTFLLLPSLYLGVIKGNTYKKTALSNIDALFSKQSVDWINKISNLRTNWHNEMIGISMINQIPEFVKNYIPNNYFELGSDFATEVLLLLENHKI